MLGVLQGQSSLPGAEGQTRSWGGKAPQHDTPCGCSVPESWIPATLSYV